MDTAVREHAFENPDYAEALIDAIEKARTGEDKREIGYLLGLDRYPVDIEEFLFGQAYLKRPRDEIYPEVLKYLKLINNPGGARISNPFTELVATGGIGSAKSTIAIYTTAYQLYILMCFKNPHRMFGMDSSTEIMFIFQSMTGGLATSVDYMRFRSLCEQSHVFTNDYPFDHKLKSLCRFPRRIEAKPIATDMGTIGQNVMGGVIDEVNFMAIVEKSKRSIDRGTYNQALEVYNSIARRRKSRFMQQGKLPGILSIVSSKRYPGEFTDQKIDEAKTDPTIFIYDKRVWDVKPAGTFSGETFRVFIGDATRSPRLMAKADLVKKPDKHLVTNVPIEYRKEFEKDIMNALRDIAGVSTLARFPYMMNVEAVVSSFGQRDSLLNQTETQFRIPTVVFYPDLIEDPKMPRWVHIDLGVTSDCAGVACGYVRSFKKMSRGEVIEYMPEIVFDFLLRVKPPQNGEINFGKIRSLLYAVRDAGLDIRWVSFDSYQSVDSMQILRQRGFSTGIISMDKTPQVKGKGKTPIAYDFFKSAIYEGRVVAPRHDHCQMELVSLEKNPKDGKVDHPPGGSKDVADAMAGVVYGLTMRREVWAMHEVPFQTFWERVKNEANEANMKEGGHGEGDEPAAKAA